MIQRHSAIGVSVHPERPGKGRKYSHPDLHTPTSDEQQHVFY